MKSLLILTMTCTVLLANGQVFNDEQVFTVTTSSLRSFHLNNMNGPVNVQGIDGNVATLRIKRKLESFSPKRLEEAKATVTFDSVMTDGMVYFFMKHPDVDFKIDENGIGHYNSCCNRDKERSHFKIKYEFEIDLQIPKQMELRVTTHRKALKIKDINGDLVAKNHHNDLFAENLGGSVTLKAHHGDITASFIRNPSDACSYSTHHGDIRIRFRESLTADIFLKSHHGEFFTDFDWTPQAVAVVENRSEKGTRYIVNEKTGIQIGGGGIRHDFKTWHGDIYLTKYGK